MIHRASSILLFTTTLLLTACSTSPQPSAPDAHNALQSLDWAGTYRGALPCADCARIETELTLNNDLSYTLSSTYVNHPPALYQSEGQFSWEANGNTINLHNDDGQRYQVGENRLFHLDSDGKRITGALAEYYVLIKDTNSEIIDSETDMDNNITERYWKLVELMGAPVKASNREPHIILKDEDKRVHGSGGCNNLSGSYELQAHGRIRFSQIAATMMACQEGMELEQRFFKALENADSYTLNGDKLVLNRARMAPLARFEAVYLK